MKWWKIIPICWLILLLAGSGCVSNTNAGQNRTVTEIPPTPTNSPTPTATLLTNVTQEVITRPVTGTIISGEPLGQALGEITLYNNDTSLDAVAALCHSGEIVARISSYLRQGEKCKFDGLADGRYDLYLTFGTGWDPNAKKFTQNATYLRYGDVLIFATSYSTNPMNTYFHFTAYDRPISSEMTNANRINPQDFPQLT